MIALAKDMRAAHHRGERLGLTEEELAFYDALETNDSKESARARLRTIVKRILRRYGYPPDKQEKAVQTVLEQAELLGKDWVA